MKRAVVSLFSGKRFVGNLKHSSNQETVLEWRDGEIQHTTVIPTEKIYNIYYF